MIDKEDRLIEGIWYCIQLEDNFHSYPLIKVEDKYHFIGKLIVHLGHRVIFNLKDGKGSVVLPFDCIKWMVPLYNPEKEEKKKKEEYLWE